MTIIIITNGLKTGRDYRLSFVSRRMTAWEMLKPKYHLSTSRKLDWNKQRRQGKSCQWFQGILPILHMVYYKYHCQQHWQLCNVCHGFNAQGVRGTLRDKKAHLLTTSHSILPWHLILPPAGKAFGFHYSILWMPNQCLLVPAQLRLIQWLRSYFQICQLGSLIFLGRGKFGTICVILLQYLTTE